MKGPVKVLVASPLETSLVDRIAGVDPRIEVMHDPDLLPRPRYPADHGGVRPDLTDAQRDRWSSMLASAEVSLDPDWRSPADLPTTAPALRWVQATSAGIGQFMERTGLDHSDITFTTAAGVHAVALAEFALTGVLYFAKGVPSCSPGSGTSTGSATPPGRCGAGEPSSWVWVRSVRRPAHCSPQPGSRSGESAGRAAATTCRARPASWTPTRWTTCSPARTSWCWPALSPRRPETC